MHRECSNGKLTGFLSTWNYYSNGRLQQQAFKINEVVIDSVQCYEDRKFKLQEGHALGQRGRVC